MNTALADFYAKDPRADISIPESKKAIFEANDSFRLARFHKKEALLKLAKARLLFESPEAIDQEFRKNEEFIERPTDAGLEDVLRELGGEWHHGSDPAYTEITISRTQELARMGLCYPWTVEIRYPPQVKAEYGSDGVILEVRDVLSWLARDLQAEHPDRATMFREIADRYYTDEEEEVDQEDEAA